MNSDWLSSGYGIVLSLGSILGLVAWLLGFIVQRPAAMKIAALGKELASSPGPPPEEKINEMALQQRKLEKAARIAAILIALSVISMPLARFIII